MGEVNGFLNEKEIKAPVDLCSSSGTLLKDSTGWSRKPVFNCNLSGRWLRKKKWNYWCVMNEQCLFSITISNIDYAGMVFAYYYDFETKKFIEKTLMIPFGKGCNMPPTVKANVSYSGPEMKADFIQENDNTHIIVESNNFNGNELKADFTVIYPADYDTLNVVIPWSERVFQFTSKHEGMSAEGSLKVGSSSYQLNPENTFACLDYGRGIWPYTVVWNWANTSGIADGRRIGLNLGAKWTDGTGMTENAMVIDGKLVKLSEDVIFEYDKNDLMKNWKIKTAISDRVDLDFIPCYDRLALTNAVILKSKVHQMMGYFTGKIKTDSGEIINIEKFPGCAEEHFGKW